MVAPLTRCAELVRQPAPGLWPATWTGSGAGRRPAARGGRTRRCWQVMGVWPRAGHCVRPWASALPTPQASSLDDPLKLEPMPCAIVHQQRKPGTATSAAVPAAHPPAAGSAPSCCCPAPARP